MKMKKVVALSLAIVMLMALMCANVSANELIMTRAETAYHYTPRLDAGVWWSGYDTGDIYDLFCNRYPLTGEDVNIGFVNTGVGLPNTFVYDLSRKGTVEVKEDDALGWNTNELLFEKTGSFTINSDGNYRMTTWSTRSNVNTNQIEDNMTLELYIRVKIQTKIGDTQTSIEPHFLGYKFYTT